MRDGCAVGNDDHLLIAQRRLEQPLQRGPVPACGPCRDGVAQPPWPAMAVTLLASWLVASRRASRRNAGFWLLLLSNVLWVAWGWFDGAWALIALQVGLAAMNIRGASNTEQQAR